MLRSAEAAVPGWARLAPAGLPGSPFAGGDMSGLALVRMGAANRFALSGRDGGHQGERLGAGAAGRGVVDA